MSKQLTDGWDRDTTRALNSIYEIATRALSEPSDTRALVEICNICEGLPANPDETPAQEPVHLDNAGSTMLSGWPSGPVAPAPPETPDDEEITTHDCTCLHPELADDPDCPWHRNHPPVPPEAPRRWRCGLGHECDEGWVRCPKCSLPVREVVEDTGSAGGGE
jgi:hypothetical protein